MACVWVFRELTLLIVHMLFLIIQSTDILLFLMLLFCFYGEGCYSESYSAECPYVEFNMLMVILLFLVLLCCVVL